MSADIVPGITRFLSPIVRTSYLVLLKDIMLSLFDPNHPVDVLWLHLLCDLGFRLFPGVLLIVIFL